MRSTVKSLTKGGEALQRSAAAELDQPVGDGEPCTHSLEPTPSHWYALYTRSHCEQLVYDQLLARGFSVFLPKMDVWSRRGGSRHQISTPMFPSYLFLRHAMDKSSFIEVSKARGLVRILGERWDRLSMVPESEIEAIQRVLHADFPVIAYPYLHTGQRVRITEGPLTGVEGILVQSKPSKGLLVLSIDLLRRSIAVEVDATVVRVA
jgi:transcription termination/antitermination protein NusG